MTWLPFQLSALHQPPRKRGMRAQAPSDRLSIVSLLSTAAVLTLHLELLQKSIHSNPEYCLQNVDAVEKRLVNIHIHIGGL